LATTLDALLAAARDAGEAGWGALESGCTASVAAGGGSAEGGVAEYKGKEVAEGSATAEAGVGAASFELAWG